MEWKVASIPVESGFCYQIYRRLNDQEPDHTGNREWGQIFDTEEEADREAESLNKALS